MLGVTICPFASIYIKRFASPAFALLSVALSAPALAGQPLVNLGAEFEVASVKINTDSNSAGYFGGGPGSKDPTLVTFAHVRMGAIVRRAFNINSSYQLATPSGLPDASYDVRGKIPAGTDESHFEQMLQNLLIERFGMKAHRESREISGYEITVAKSGVKLRPLELSETPPDPDTPVGASPLVRDRRGELQLPPGRKARMVVRLSDGRFRHTARMQEMADIVAMCARELGKPVLDHTALSGSFDFNIDFVREPDEPGQKMDDAATPFLAAFQAQTGLRLESRKVPAEVVVIDFIAALPTEN